MIQFFLKEDSWTDPWGFSDLGFVNFWGKLYWNPLMCEKIINRLNLSLFCSKYIVYYHISAIFPLCLKKLRYCSGFSDRPFVFSSTFYWIILISGWDIDFTFSQNFSYIFGIWTCLKSFLNIQFRSLDWLKIENLIVVLEKKWCEF